MSHAAARSEVFACVEAERRYQDERWSELTTTSGGQHSVGEWAVFIDDYLRQLKTELSRTPEPEATDLALHTLRKIAAMAVACMEQNGVRHRQAGPET